MLLMNSLTNNHRGCENVDKISLRSSLQMEGNELRCSKTGPKKNRKTQLCYDAFEDGA